MWQIDNSNGVIPEMSNNDYAADAAEASATNNSDALARLQQMAERQADAEQLVLAKTEELKAAQDALAVIAERDLPALMEELGMEMFQTSSGLVIKIKETIRASIPKSCKGRALDWLREDGHGALIKRAISAEFGRDEDAAAEKLAEELLARGYLVEDDASVHPSTLSAFVREALADGREIPMDLLGVFRQRKSVIEIGR